MGRYYTHLKAGCIIESRFIHLISQCSKCYVHLFRLRMREGNFSVCLSVHQELGGGWAAPVLFREVGWSCPGKVKRGVLPRQDQRSPPPQTGPGFGSLRRGRYPSCDHTRGLSCLQRRKFVQQIIYNMETVVKCKHLGLNSNKYCYYKVMQLCSKLSTDS